MHPRTEEEIKQYAESTLLDIEEVGPVLTTLCDEDRKLLEEVRGLLKWQKEFWESSTTKFPQGQIK